MNRFTIEHWRDGERIATFDLYGNVVRTCEGAKFVLPPGMVTLTTGDELRFDPQGLIDLLEGT